MNRNFANNFRVLIICMYEVNSCSGLFIPHMTVIQMDRIMDMEKKWDAALKQMNNIVKE